jgi:hypothetical protein
MAEIVTTYEQLVLVLIEASFELAGVFIVFCKGEAPAIQIRTEQVVPRNEVWVPLSSMLHGCTVRLPDDSGRFFGTSFTGEAINSGMTLEEIRSAL